MIYKKAETVKTEPDLLAFLKEIKEYNHDYGTIVYGCMAAMKAAFKVVNNSPNGGITGFQAGCLGWECIHEFMSVKAPAKILQYDNMLYPQYQDKFEKVISRETWEDLQKKAKEHLNKDSGHPDVVKHWRTIVDGHVPFGYSVNDQ
jgi:hypothetical protein